MTRKARAIGINHVALEVGDIGEALAFYGALFDFELRGRLGDRMAFVDLGDQFVALSAPRRSPPDEHRHFGLVVDDADAVRRALDEAGVPVFGSRGNNFRDPWGNWVQIVQYDEVQFTKAPEVLRAMGAGGLGKTEAALEELRAKGMEPAG
ncbi:MAG TPA: VOC family protein [Solirubrobacteraceae bacterium]|nr:VOC family protein [Solirubrobacteraceae bacterium]